MKIAVTGHRPDKLDYDYSLKLVDYGSLKNAIRRELATYISVHKPTELISGMALGVDQIFASIAMFMDIPLTAAIPFKGQELKWPQESQKYYHFLLQYATKKEYICDPGYAAWKMQKRNEWMVDYCDLLIGVWDGSTGGTKNCLDYANQKDKKIHIIDLKELREYV